MRYLFFTVFMSGMTTLAVEMSDSHLMGPYFGDNRLVWASIIGLILVYLTIGYLLGGKLADRYPYPQYMYRILAWGAFSIGIIPFAAAPILTPAANAFDQLQLGILFASFVAMLILFSIPLTLLGTISPYAIRLAIQDKESSGSIAGKIYAVSTLGSFLGTFLPTLVLIPFIGTRATFFLFSFLLLLVAFGGLAQTSGVRSILPLLWMAPLLALFALHAVRMPYKNTQNQIYETESSYNYIQVLEKDQRRYLRLNEGQGVHSEYHPQQIGFQGPWEQFLVAPFFNKPPFTPQQVKRIAIIGLAGGTIARQATAVFGEIPIDGYELDAKIIEVGKQYFGMTQPNLNPIAEDGRWGITHNPHHYDFIAVDAYRPPYIPWHLTTREFFQTLSERLTENGTIAINVGHAPQDRRLIDALAGTMQTVFPSVHVMDVPNTFNAIVYATKQPTSWIYLYQNYLILSKDKQTHPLLIEAMGITILNQQPTPSQQLVFTDDKAPVEWLTHSLILHFMLSGGLNELQ